ncbi:major facilitator superfamily domain-containing protein [Jimgerdemannia flammicorona]|uniref:Major facilitator superfamily domain-containing protein n=1 Tax=Jimgerdemannia flammicorona TaxID=994334 RepID=A0A433QGB8_9FUNG|nr:major facilitator superfamily domain-containing protein [Jimgerdemannia flammicorona]
MGIGGAGMHIRYGERCVYRYCTPPKQVQIFKSEHWLTFRYLSFHSAINIFATFSSLVGPVIGGSLTDYLSWRWTFYVNVPLVIIAGCVVYFHLNIPKPQGSLIEKLKRIDYVGSTLALGFSILLLLGLNWGGFEYTWSSPQVVSCLTLAVVFVVLLIFWEIKQAIEPLIPMGLFRNRTLMSVFSLNVFFGMVFYQVGWFCPYYFQVVRGDDATTSGLRTLPAVIIGMIVSFGNGWLISHLNSYRPFLWCGASVLLVNAGLLSMLDETSSWGLVYTLVTLNSCAVNIMVGATIIAVQAAADNSSVAIVTGLCSFFRIMGGAIGLATGGAVLNNSLLAILPSLIPTELVTKSIQSVEFVRMGLMPDIQAKAVHGYVLALRNVWLECTTMAGISLGLSMFVQHYSLRRKATTTVGKKAEVPAPGDVVELEIDAKEVTNEKVEQKE